MTVPLQAIDINSGSKAVDWPTCGILFSSAPLVSMLSRAMCTTPVESD